MKRKLIGNILFTLILVAFFSIGSDVQTVNSLQLSRTFNEGIHIESYVYYRLDHRNNVKSADVKIDKVRLKKNSLFRIVGITFNGQNVPKRDGGHYYQYFVPFKCFIGKVLEIKVGIRKKGRGLNPVQYITVGKYKVKNYIKKYSFPTPNSTIKLTDYTDSIPFNWVFATSPETMNFRIIPTDSRSPVLSESSSGTGYNVPVNVLTAYTKYSIHLDSSDKNFVPTSTASPNSKLIFSHHCTLYFKTN